MRFAIVITSLLGLAAMTGCARQGNHVAVPDSSDPAWTPPGEAMLTIQSSDASERTASNGNASAAPHPNRCQIKSKQIHAASY